MSYLFSNYARAAKEMINGQGNYLTDNQGHTYLDFTSGIGVAVLGYNHPQVKQGVTDQLDKLWHSPNLYESQLQEKVAEKLSVEGNYLAFFCNSGAEANEAAIKLARKATGKAEIITFDHSFHGRTYGAMSATAQEKIQTGFAPLVPGFTYLPYNDYEAIRNGVKEETAAVLLELIQGEGGILPADREWVQALAKVCKETNTLLMIDEVQTGIGRTGSLFAFQDYDIEPDIFTLAKALGNGIPVGAMLGKKELGSAFGPGSHGSTFGGNKLAMAAAEQVLTIVSQPSFLLDVHQKGHYLLKQLVEMTSSCENVKEVRGKGLMIGIELFSGVPEVMAQLEAAGLLVLQAGSSVIRLLPPLTITEEEITLALKIMSQVLTTEKVGGKYGK